MRIMAAVAIESAAALVAARSNDGDFSSTFVNASGSQTFAENANRSGRYINFAGGKKAANLQSYNSQLGFGETWNDRFSADA